VGQLKIINNMYICIPKKLKFCLDKDRHSVSISEQFKDYNPPAESYIDAAIGNSEAEAIERVLENARKHISSFWQVGNGTIKVSDFEIAYSLQRVVNNLFCAGNLGVSYKKL
jgi:hypothetical protein